MALQLCGVVHAAEPKLLRDAVGSLLEPTNRRGDGSGASAGIAGRYGLDVPPKPH
jgi:hypothetical protein